MRLLVAALATLGHQLTGISTPPLTPGTAGRQMAGGDAAMGCVLPPGAPSPLVRIWGEMCSSYAHCPADRQLLE